MIKVIKTTPDYIYLSAYNVQYRAPVNELTDIEFLNCLGRWTGFLSWHHPLYPILHRSFVSVSENTSYRK